MNTMETVLETIQAMKQQEETVYRVWDYFADMQQQQQQQNSSSSSSSSSSLLAIDLMMMSREAVAVYYSGLIDGFQLPREIGDIAMNLLDRFFCTKQGQDIINSNNLFLFRVVSLTALYTCIKVQDPSLFTSGDVAEMICTETPSLDILDAIQQVEDMELLLLQAIHWRINPPTTLAFVRQYIQLLQVDNNDNNNNNNESSSLLPPPPPSLHLVGVAPNEIYQLAMLQINVITGDYFFASKKKSEIALAATKYALNVLMAQTTDPSLSNVYESIICQATNINTKTSDFKSIQLQLCKRIHQQRLQQQQQQAATAMSQTTTATTSNGDSVSTTTTTTTNDSPHCFGSATSTNNSHRHVVVSPRMIAESAS